MVADRAYLAGDFMADTRSSRAEHLNDRAAPAGLLLLAGFAATMFLSALLLFAVQPLFARLVLPVLGGSPAVWSVAMCFFQAALLGGYAYAHVLGRHIRTPLAVIIHLAVMMAAMLALPLAIADGWTHPPTDGQHFWVLGLFAVSIGLPFFALAGNAPLLQAWFSRTGHRHADDPYFLYGASNLGSLLALVSYPLVVEPALTLAAQSELWTAGYKILAVCVGFSGLAMLLKRAPRPVEGPECSRAGAAASSTVGWSDRMAWLGLAFVPSGLLVAVTSHITTDVAAAPFLWVMPLALFLLTFVITFQRRPWIPHNAMLALQPVAVAALILALQFPVSGYWPLFLAIHLAGFFVNAMVCHGVLVSRRPAAAQLTQFYLWMSLGGALGGLFAGLIAPQIFATVLEYPVMVFLALLARPGLISTSRAGFVRDAALAAALLFLVTAPKLVLGVEVIQDWPKFYIAVFALLALATLHARPHAVRLAAIVAVALTAGHFLKPEAAKGMAYRGFFGVNRVVETPDGRFRLLMHGTTIHGAQAMNVVPGTPPEPLTYYHRDGPFADVFAALRTRRGLQDVALVGLGTGSLACYRQDGETWRFYEIDPIVVRLASDATKFNFLSACAPDAPLIVGDARLTLSDQPDRIFDLIVIDAFSSDAIPVHLLTLEAVRIYLRKLSAQGALALHISNRNMDLRPVVAAAARELGLAAVVRHGGGVGATRETYKTPATLVALARDPVTLAPLVAREGWSPLHDAAWQAWRDDYSNVLRAILEKTAGRLSQR